MRDRRDRADRIEGQAVAGMHFEAEPRAVRRRGAQPFKLAFHAFAIAIEEGVAIGTGVELNHRRAEPRGRLKLALVRIDKQRHP